jgi:hypothetical protein
MSKVRLPLISDYEWYSIDEKAEIASEYRFNWDKETWKSHVARSKSFDAAKQGFQVSRVYKDKALIMFTTTHNGAYWYITELFGTIKDKKYLLEWFIKKVGGPIRTHQLPKWGKIDLLKEVGFKHVGKGNPKREKGKWVVDISKLEEFWYL